MFVVYRLQNRRLRFCHHPPQNHPFLTTRIGIIEDGLLRICRVKPDRLIVVVSLYRIVCYLSIAGAFNVIPGRINKIPSANGIFYFLLALQLIIQEKGINIKLMQWLNGRALDSKSKGCRFDSCLCQFDLFFCFSLHHKNTKKYIHAFLFYFQMFFIYLIFFLEQRFIFSNPNQPWIDIRTNKKIFYL